MLWFNNRFSLVKSKEDDLFFAFDKKTEKKHYLNSDLFDLLCELSKISVISDEIENKLSEMSILETLLEKEILVKQFSLKADNIFIQSSDSIDRLFLEVSRKCNLRCKHCYNESSQLLTDFLSYDDIRRLAVSAKKMGAYIFQITGGEPLIRKDIQQIIELVGGLGFKITIFTNLTYLPETIIIQMKKFQIKVVTSVDFLDSFKHDEFRGRRGALKATLRNINRLLENNVDVRVNMMIDGKSDEELEELINYLKCNLKVPYIADVIIPTGRGKKNFDKEYLKNVAKKYKDIAIDSVMNGGTLDLSNTISCSTNCIYSNDCGVGSNFLFVDSLGNATICPSMRKEDSEKFYFGNITTDSLDKIVSTFRNHRVEVSCKYEDTCLFAKQCKGGCRSRAFHFLGDIREVDPIMCNVYKENSFDE